jgi:hypothetical protein
MITSEASYSSDDFHLVLNPLVHFLLVESRGSKQVRGLSSSSRDQPTAGRSRVRSSCIFPHAAMSNQRSSTSSMALDISPWMTGGNGFYTKGFGSKLEPRKRRGQATKSNHLSPFPIPPGSTVSSVKRGLTMSLIRPPNLPAHRSVRQPHHQERTQPGLQKLLPTSIT